MKCKLHNSVLVSTQPVSGHEARDGQAVYLLSDVIVTRHLRGPAPGKDTFPTVYITTTGHHLFGRCAIHDFKNIRARVHGILSPRSFESYPMDLLSTLVVHERV
jgi:hypothetical protein